MPFVQEYGDFAPRTTAKLVELLEDEDNLINLQIELTALLDVGTHFVKATYNLEGDGLLFFTVYSILQEFLEACNAPQYRQVTAAGQKIAQYDISR